MFIYDTTICEFERSDFVFMAGDHARLSLRLIFVPKECLILRASENKSLPMTLHHEPQLKSFQKKTHDRTQKKDTVLFIITLENVSLSHFPIFSRRSKVYTVQPSKSVTASFVIKRVSLQGISWEVFTDEIGPEGHSERWGDD